MRIERTPLLKTKQNFDIFHFFFVYPKATNILNGNRINDFSLNTLYTKLESILNCFKEDVRYLRVRERDGWLR